MYNWHDISRVIVVTLLLYNTVNSYYMCHLKSKVFCFLLQEVELWEACWYGLVEQVYHLLTTGVNVNIITFVSGQHGMNFEICSQYCAGTVVHSCTG